MKAIEELTTNNTLHAIEQPKPNLELAISHGASHFTNTEFISPNFNPSEMHIS